MRVFGPTTIVAIALGVVLGWAASLVLFLGWWTLVPWGVAGVGLGHWTGQRGAMLAGAAYGFALCFVFTLAGYKGAAPTVTRVPFFAVFGLVGGVCGLLLAALGAFLKRRAHPEP